ncbi:hypothetical protein [Paenibacillus bovis]|uniref:Uncharacterized protein n=1 Tax=Paenibacillus bovis TaxID=1616788 RepID=A0A1X9T413_9BACL|nr:hypothetical protein [Paenibacillus bovis]ARR10678.1 hypothetical protein AR543_p0070 [Paenibacillus bovis]
MTVSVFTHYASLGAIFWLGIVFIMILPLWFMVLTGYCPLIIDKSISLQQRSKALFIVSAFSGTMIIGAVLIGWAVTIAAPYNSPSG